MARFGIRKKIGFGGGGLVLLLVSYAALSIHLLKSRDQAIEDTFKNNGDSMAYMHDLTGAVDQLDSLLRTSLNANVPLNPTLALPLETSIQRNIVAELQNITENGEGPAASSLNQGWEQYRHDLSLLPHESNRHHFYSSTLSADEQTLRSLAWEIAGLNLQNARFRDHARNLLWTEERWMLALLAISTALAATLLGLLGTSLVGPVLELIKGVTAVREGNLNQEVPVRSLDELGDLATAFNAMAGRLRIYERGFRARLMRTQRTTQLAINSFSDPVAVLGPSGQVELCNRAASHFFGLSQGKSLADSQLASLQRFVEPALGLGQAYEPQDYSEAIKILSGNREKFILPRLIPVLDDQDKVVGVTLVMADVTGLKKTDEMKSGLLATVSHELKNPLTSLRMGAHLMLEDSMGPRNERQEALLRTLRDNSDRLHSILEDLLDIGRMDLGDFLKIESRSAVSILRSSLDRARPDFEKNDIHVETKIDAQLPSIAVDPQRIGHIFSNLFDNAIKYAGAASTLQVGASRVGTGVKFWVQDNGPGISAEHRSKIFERFFRVPGSEVGRGIGLGLAIAKELAELHGGSLKLEESSQGACFVLFLPCDLNSTTISAP